MTQKKLSRGLHLSVKVVYYFIVYFVFTTDDEEELFQDWQKEYEEWRDVHMKEWEAEFEKYKEEGGCA